MRKFVVWYHNKTSRDDDEWIAVLAKNSEEATAFAREKMQSHRFSLGTTYTIREFKKFFGKNWPIGQFVKIPKPQKN